MELQARDDVSGCFCAVTQVRPPMLASNPFNASPRVADAPAGLGKSAMLGWLGQRVRSASVPDFVVVDAVAWRRDRHAASTRFRLRFPEGAVAVRSDAVHEDTSAQSSAGCFLSMLEVPVAHCDVAVDRVVESMGPHPGNAVIVQAMVVDRVAYAVASTHRLHDGAPWYCLETADSDQPDVTAGRSNGRQRCFLRSALHSDPGLAAALTETEAGFLRTLLEVEALLPGLPLELELVAQADAQGQPRIALLQARPIVQANWPRACPPAHPPALDWLSCRDPLPGVTAQSTVLSAMADWNPAELVGLHPRPLARSVFTGVLGRGTWWAARSVLGYARCPTPQVQLFQQVAGRLYVDTRRSAHSLLPAVLPADAAGRIVDLALDRLCQRPETHDKFEFAVMRTCIDLSDAKALREAWHALDHGRWDAWQLALRRLTAGLLERYPALCAMQTRPDPSRSESTRTCVDMVHVLAGARRQARLFAAQARLAFVAESMLRGAVARQAISPSRAADLRAASGVLAALASGVRRGCHPGWMRSGTFDITQPSWNERGVSLSTDAHEPAVAFVPSQDEQTALRQLLADAGLFIEATRWFEFVPSAIRARELGKLALSQWIGCLFELLERWGASIELSREELSWLALERLAPWASMDLVRRARLHREIDEQRQLHAQQAQLMLGPLLRAPEDAWRFDSLGLVPNFVGRNAIDGRVVLIDEIDGFQPGEQMQQRLQDSVVVLRHADPGFDWLFGYGIAGLITAWGGANSHMAIRCGELGIPAALGCGEVLFERARSSGHVRIDPREGVICLR